MAQQNTPNQQAVEEMIRAAAQQLGADPQKLKASAQNGSIEGLMKNLRPQDAQALQKVLADKDATAKILATPQAQALMKKLFERK